MSYVNCHLYLMESNRNSITSPESTDAASLDRERVAGHPTSVELGPAANRDGLAGRLQRGLALPKLPQHRA